MLWLYTVNLQLQNIAHEHDIEEKPVVFFFIACIKGWLTALDTSVG